METYVFIGVLAILFIAMGIGNAVKEILRKLKESNETLNRMEDSFEERFHALKDEVAALGGDVARIEDKFN